LLAKTRALVAPLIRGRTPGDAEPPLGHGSATDLAGLASGVEAAATVVAAERLDLAMLRAAIDAIAEPVVATTADGVVVIVNHGARRAFSVGLSTRARRMEDLIAHADILALHEAARQGRAVGARVRMVTADGARVFEVTATPVGAPMGVAEPGGDVAAPEPRAAPRRWGVALSFRDVSDLATAVQARTDFVANASHELRTPLAALRASFDTLRLAMDDPRMRERALHLAAGNLDRLEDMTRDLLDLSRVESPDAAARAELVDVRILIEEAAAPFEAARAARRVDLSIEVAAGARRARTDPRLLQAILRNLIDNACRFAHEGTTVRVVAEAVGGPTRGEATALAGPGPGVAASGAPATLRLRVIDRGIGIPLDQQARIFERFYQVDPARTGKRRGTGLGLSIVKHAARALGGSVDVESVWGEGTTMIVELPGAVVAALPASGV
jgi:signal transduction histidine kinase